ncbi:MAG: DUF707 domain-containing protein [Roseburia sp.]|nr:DUF707 domain-containing protein [Roseburia sp.]MCM1420462.1 DUF707 domain-containing protein [Bacteroides sp.]
MNKNCVISAVGKNSLHKMWTESNGNFDLHLIVYDNSLEMFCNDAEYTCHIKGYKLKVIYKYLEANPQFKDTYDYFFFPDDDIRMNATNINALFEAMRRYNLKIAQPALRMSYYTWPHTLYNRYCKLRYTNFVEMMAPCFSRDALQKVLFTFNENETGWSTETHWSILINASIRDMGIIDEVNVIHTRPIQSGQEIHHKELAAYMKKFGLKTQVYFYDMIPSQNEHVYCCDKTTFTSICSTLVHWISSEKISSMNIGEDGYWGYVHFLFLLADITQAQKYADAALELLAEIQDGLGQVKDDMSFSHGIAGCCWLIEFLAGENLLHEDPLELLEEVDVYIQQYAKDHADSLTIAELTGIGKYYLVKFQNRPDTANKNALQDMSKLIKMKINLSQKLHDMRVFLDTLEILNECGTDISDLECSLERLIYQTELSQLERMYYLFRLYTITHEEYLHVRVMEELKNFIPQLISLADALMLAEILYYKQNCNHNHNIR